MRTAVCDLFGIEYPIFAFTRSAAVVAEVSKAGGLGVLGAIAFTPDDLADELVWLDENVDGHPYGVDVVLPAKIAEGTKFDLESMIPAGHREWVNDLLARHGVPQLPEGEEASDVLSNFSMDRSREHADIALSHPIKLLANALGPPPPDAIEAAHAKGVLIGALCGTAEHARRQADAGCDFIVAQGTEAGGHTGAISTMVLIPEVVAAVGDVPVLAAGGIGSGMQAAAAIALGAQGVWTGSIWLTVQEADTQPALVEKLLHAEAGDTVRTRAMTGKTARLLRTTYTDAWDAPESPGALPMPLQFILTAEAQSRLYRFAEQHDGARELVTSPVGQIVGAMNEVHPAREVVQRFVREFDDAAARLSKAARN
jgi:NAD(P)H-dependent flavin oxidoreductase YrpB (nitropropane dioxygenase family)